MFHCSHPNALFQPRLHPRGCSGENLLGLGCQGCSGACSTPFSRLLQPSVSSVVDLGVMAFGHHPLPSHSLCGPCHTFRWGPFSLCSCQYVRGTGWPPSISGKRIFHVPVHPASRHFLRFMFRDTVYQFKALCFGLSTAPQVFTRVMAPVSAILHSLGIRMRQYLDDWLIQSSSQESLLEDLPTVLRLCHDLGIVIHPRKSSTSYLPR